MGGWSPGTGTLAQAEALAGINPQDPAERATLWQRFSHWSAAGHAQMAVDAVVDHCATITMERVRRGELSLFNPNMARAPRLPQGAVRDPEHLVQKQRQSLSTDPSNDRRRQPPG